MLEHKQRNPTRTTLLFAKRCHEWSSRGGWSTHEACEVSNRVVRRVPPIADAVLEQLGLTQKGDRECCGGHSHFRDSRSTKGRPPRGRETGGGGSTGLEHKSTGPVPPSSKRPPALEGEFTVVWTPRPAEALCNRKFLIAVAGYRHFMSTGTHRAYKCFVIQDCGVDPLAENSLV